MDIVIRDVPEEVVFDVKQMASEAVERHYRKNTVALQPKELQDNFEATVAAVNAFCEANGLLKKFDVVEK